MQQRSLIVCYVVPGLIPQIELNGNPEMKSVPRPASLIGISASSSRDSGEGIHHGRTDGRTDGVVAAAAAAAAAGDVSAATSADLEEFIDLLAPAGFTAHFTRAEAHWPS